jgi:YVTN family beta-propeller protein
VASSSIKRGSNGKVVVGDNPKAIAVNEGTNTVYVSNEYSNTVSVINGTTNTKITDIAVDNCAFNIAVNEGTNISFQDKSQFPTKFRP